MDSFTFNLLNGKGFIRVRFLYPDRVSAKKVVARLIELNIMECINRVNAMLNRRSVLQYAPTVLISTSWWGSALEKIIDQIDNI